MRYSYRGAIETAEDTLKALIEDGLSEVELMEGPIRSFAGMGGGDAWIQPDRTEREPLTLEAVRLIAELGVDVNAANVDGRTALDAAKASKYDSVVRFLLDNGARSGMK